VLTKDVGSEAVVKYVARTMLVSALSSLPSPSLHYLSHTHTHTSPLRRESRIAAARVDYSLLRSDEDLSHGSLLGLLGAMGQHDGRRAGRRAAPGDGAEPVVVVDSRETRSPLCYMLYKAGIKVRH
jgi:hypothetical protein